MKPLGEYEIWFAVGAQELYGEAALRSVDEHGREIAAALDTVDEIPVSVSYRGTLVAPASIRAACLEANAAPACVGLVVWAHTFSPAKMWIAGLSVLAKPLLHLHTQFNRELPWSELDMDFMNLNQSAHADRELASLQTRAGIRRKTVVGHWSDPATTERIGTWTRAACGWHEAQSLTVARFGDNMRQVSVTEGDKVQAQLRLGFSVNGYGIGDLVEATQATSDDEVGRIAGEYDEQYELVPALRDGGAQRTSLLEAARIEAGLRAFLDAGGFKAFTDTFEDLGGLVQLPGIGVQRLMAEGYGFGAEGDWKTAALLRIGKVMSRGLPGGTSFMEDYTYELSPRGPKVLGAHMLEVCPSLAAERPSCEIHPLSIGARADPVRLVFDAAAGPAVCVALMDLGDRFRLLLGEVDVVPPDRPLPKLPVARAVWTPKPDLTTAAEAWLMAGGAHHTVLSLALGSEIFADFADIAGLELLVIDGDTRIREFAKELRWNAAYYRSVGS